MKYPVIEKTKLSLSGFKEICNDASFDSGGMRLLSYLKTYPALVQHFQKGINSPEALIVAAHIAYGWMPTTLTVHGGIKEHEEAFESWNRLVYGSLEDEKKDLNVLSSIFNNSIVGVSKMLHFAAPKKFAIWDSKVAAACNYTLHGNRRRNAGAYLEYVGQLKKIVEDNEFIPTYNEVKKLITDNVLHADKLSRLRVGELLLFSSQAKSSIV